MPNPKFSIVIPIHEGMKNGDFFLWRLVQSLMRQTFKDFEIVITQEGKMAENTNAGIKKSRGELIKILYLDDYLAHKNALKVIADSFGKDDQWLVTGCLHQSSSLLDSEDPHSPHYPSYTEDIHLGNNRLGSPSAITLRNKGHLLFDENLSFLLDCDLYKRLHTKYGEPKLINDLNVVIGLHDGQMSNTMSNEEKSKEFDYMQKKFNDEHDPYRF